MRVLNPVINAGVACGAVGLVAWLGDPPAAAIVDVADHPRAQRFVDAAWELGRLAWEHQVVSGVLLGLYVAPALYAGLVAQVSRLARKDPKRLYGPAERRKATEWAVDRCEGENWLMLRCRRRAEEGDHWLPHSLGGATSRRNLVMLCAKCNRAKSALVPTLWHSARLAWRRLRYYPSGLSRWPGERYR